MAGEIFTILVLILLVMAAWTAGHAADNGKTELWGLLVFFTGMFGLVIYAISLASDGGN
jgi:TctA family transporter